MRFNLETAGTIYCDSDEINRLKSLGFKFTQDDKQPKLFYIEYQSTPQIEFSTLKDLSAFIDKFGDVAITKEDYNYTLYIWDGYL